MCEHSNRDNLTWTSMHSIGMSAAGGLGQREVVHGDPRSCLKVQMENEHLMGIYRSHGAIPGETERHF